MSRRRTSSDMNLQALLEGGKALPRVPDSARARVLARARATAVLPLALHEPLPAERPPWARSWVAPTAGALVVGGVVAALVTGHGRSPGHACDPRDV